MISPAWAIHSASAVTTLIFRKAGRHAPAQTALGLPIARREKPVSEEMVAVAAGEIDAPDC